MSNNEPELEFWDHIPTAWDETRVLQGTPGEFITTARRKGQEWFVGSITNNQERTIKIDCSFLPKGKTFTARIYSDDATVATATKVKITEKDNRRYGTGSKTASVRRTGHLDKTIIKTCKVRHWVLIV